MSTIEPGKQIHETTLGTSPQVRAILEVTADSRLLRVIAGNAKPQEFPLPDWLTTTDLPIWMSSVVRQAAPCLAEAEITQYENRIRRMLPVDSKTVTVVIGRREEIVDVPIFHFPRKDLPSTRRDSFVTLQVKNEQPFLPPELWDWTFTFFTSSVDAAHDLQYRILRTRETFFCLGASITGIIASNRERWETAGVSQAVVEALAAERKVSLRLVCQEADLRFAFRCQ